MPRNGSGGYALDPSTWNPGVDGVTATTSDWNVKVKADLETAIAGSVAADGQTPMSGALDMGNNRVTNVLAPNSVTDAATAGEIQSGAWQYLTSVAGTNTITASVTGLTAYAAGQTFRAVIANTNTGAVTLNINSVGGVAVTKNGSTALVAGDLLAGAAVEVVYDGTQFQLVTPSESTIGAALRVSASAAAAQLAIATTGTVLQKLVFTDAGSSTGSSSLTSITGSAKSITPRSSNSTLLVEVTFDASITAGGAATNTIATFQLYNNTTAANIGAAYVLGTSSSAGANLQTQGMGVVRASISNAALTAVGFILRAQRGATAATAAGANHVWTITEIQN